MRYLLLNSLLAACVLTLPACRSVYKDLRPVAGDPGVLNKFKPEFSRALYTAQVDVVGNHLSGLLLIKAMPDSSLRIVFSNEMGFKFFDFEFSSNGEFKVHYIIKKMDKKAVITTLRKDFELVLMSKTDSSAVKIFTREKQIYYRFPQQKGYNYYITDAGGTELIRMERASSRKPVAIAIMRGDKLGTPDTIGITHKNFNFEIGLKRTEN